MKEYIMPSIQKMEIEQEQNLCSSTGEADENRNIAGFEILDEDFVW